MQSITNLKLIRKTWMSNENPPALLSFPSRCLVFRTAFRINVCNLFVYVQTSFLRPHLFRFSRRSFGARIAVKLSRLAWCHLHSGQHPYMFTAMFMLTMIFGQCCLAATRSSSRSSLPQLMQNLKFFLLWIIFFNTNNTIVTHHN